MIKIIQYIKYFDIFSDKNHGKNGLFSLEGFLIILISAFLIGDRSSYTDFITQIAQKDAAQIAENTIIIASVCLGMMIFLYAISIITIRNVEQSLNSFSWTIIVIFLSSLSIFIFRYSGKFLQFIVTHTHDLEKIFIPLIVLLLINLIAKALNFPDVKISKFLLQNPTKAAIILISSSLYLFTIENYIN